jgi:hypothetical protein
MILIARFGAQTRVLKTSVRVCGIENRFVLCSLPRLALLGARTCRVLFSCGRDAEADGVLNRHRQSRM